MLCERLAIDEPREITECSSAPATRDTPDIALLELLNSDEVDEPRVEYGFYRLLKVSDEPPITVYLVGERAKHAPNAPLLLDWRKCDQVRLDSAGRGVEDLAAGCCSTDVPIEFRIEEQPVCEVGVKMIRVAKDDSAKSLVMQIQTTVVRNLTWDAEDLATLRLAGHDQQDVPWQQPKAIRELTRVSLELRSLESEAAGVLEVADTNNDRVSVVRLAEELALECVAMLNGYKIAKGHLDPSLRRTQVP